jgi:hypothetical protein
VTPFYRGFTPAIVIPPAAVIPETGEITGSLRWNTNVGFERINNANQVYQGSVALKLEVINPALPEALPHLATPFISLSQIGETTFDRIIQATLTYSFNVSESTPMPLTTDQVIVTESGAWSSTTQFTLPTDYSQWAQDNGLVNPDPEATNSAGIPWVFLYNMDLPTTTSALPISVVTEGGAQLVEIVLPEAGLKLPMGVEFSGSLNAGTWNPLPPLFYPPNNPDPLAPGATGSPRFVLPIPGRCFMRFTTEL